MKKECSRRFFLSLSLLFASSFLSFPLSLSLSPSHQMSVVAVLGAQWGDEGKGKLVDVLAQQADVVARCQVLKINKNNNNNPFCLQISFLGLTTCPNPCLIWSLIRVGIMLGTRLLLMGRAMISTWSPVGWWMRTACQLLEMESSFMSRPCSRSSRN